MVPTIMYRLESIEKKQNIKFPEALYKTDFKEIGSRMEIHVGNDRVLSLIHI